MDHASHAVRADSAGQGGGIHRHWLSLAGGVVGFAILAWVLSRIDYARLRVILEGADLAYVALVPAAVAAEQLLRAWKWRQILHAIRPISTLHLFGAMMAGNLANLLMPVGVSPLVRSWLVARIEVLSITTILASAAVDRLIDGVVFAGIVFLVVALAPIPEADAEIRLALAAGAALSLVAFAGVLIVLWRHKRSSAQGLGWILRVTDRLPHRFVGRARAMALSFGQGVVWPERTARQLAILTVSVLVRMIAGGHFLLAGLAFGVRLDPSAYLVLIAILGFSVVLTHFARVPGGFVVGGMFALGLFGVDEEHAFAIVSVVVTSTLLVVAVAGGFTLWRHGIALRQIATGGMRSKGSD